VKKFIRSGDMLTIGIPDKQNNYFSYRLWRDPGAPPKAGDRSRAPEPDPGAGNRSRAPETGPRSRKPEPGPGAGPRSRKPETGRGDYPLT
jgi:hypothetical protein